MKRKIKLLFICVLAAALLLACGILLHRGNTRLTVSEYTVSLPALPAAFDGLRVVQISDLHDACFGDSQQLLGQTLQALAPDIIVVTGDLFDSSRPDVENSLAAMRQAIAVAPCWYVPGNHEQRRPVQYAALKEGLAALGVTVLENGFETLRRGDAAIRIAGLADSTFYAARYGEAGAAVFLTDMKKLTEGSGFTLLLSHRPELFGRYSGVGAQLVFSGHAHGGQIRLPLIGGLFAPGQGLFPQYTAGVHTHQGTAMVVSRGLGNSAFPLRLCNAPELVLAVLRCA